MVPRRQLLAAVALIAIAALSAGTGSAQTSRSLRLADYINAARLGAGLGLLSENLKLSLAASRHADDMADNNFVEHTGSDGSVLADRVERVGYAWSVIAENVAAGQPTPQQTVRAWMKSEAHRLNILKEDVEELGVGYAVVGGVGRKRGYRHYWVVIFAKARRR